MSLYPSWVAQDDEEMMEDAQDEIVEGSSYAYDLEKQEIIITQTGKTLRSDEHQSYLLWAYKALSTERYRYPYYSTDYGVEISEILQQDYKRPVTESEIKRTIDEALRVDERTVSTSDYHFDWGVDSVVVTFSLESVYNTDTITLKR